MSYLTALLIAVTFHVDSSGSDDPSRDGLQRESAFASLAYACDRLPEGTPGEPNIIRLGPGEYMADRTAVVPANTSVFGAGFHGKAVSRLVASNRWPLEASVHDAPLGKQALIRIKKNANDVVLFGLLLESPEDRHITGGLSMEHAQDVKIDFCRFRNFRWFGIHAANSSRLQIDRCSFRHCSSEKHRYRGGQIFTSWLADSEIQRSRFVPMQPGGGYGYKGGGHRHVRFHDNIVDDCYFAIESPHENEIAFEIDHNELRGAISVPKGGPGKDPRTQGAEYSVEIHHNRITDSYAIEGPRNFLRVHHNHIQIAKPNGRVYAHFGGSNPGPVRIDHNVIENVDRGLVWVREGYFSKLTFENNTVSIATAPGREGTLFSVYSSDRLDDWVVRNNIFVGPWNSPRTLMNIEREVPSKINFRDNVCVNILGVPSGNTNGEYPDLVRGDSDKPWDYFMPRSNSSLNAGAIQRGDAHGAVGPRRK